MQSPNYNLTVGLKGQVNKLPAQTQASGVGMSGDAHSPYTEYQPIIVLCKTGNEWKRPVIIPSDHYASNTINVFLLYFYQRP